MGMAQAWEIFGGIGWVLQCWLVKWRNRGLNSRRMTFSRNRFLGIFVIGWFTATSVCGEVFLAPAEGPIAFRRDRIPLDVDTMATLSRQLVNLAEGLDGAEAASRRGAAQMLALSVALDPANQKARVLMERFQKKGFQPAADAQQIQASREKIWNVLEWLELPEAGEAGNALAACLTDVVLVSDPKHPKAEGILAKGEQGSWRAWVPELSAYERKAPVEIDPPEAEMPEVVTPSASVTLLPAAQVFTPLWKEVGAADPPRWILASGALEMSSEMADDLDPIAEPEPFSMVIGSEDDDSFTALSITILRLIKQIHPELPLPDGGRVSIHGKALEKSSESGMRQSISAAAAVLASAAVTGQEPQATIIGVVDQKGAFDLPTGFWDQLQSLTTGEGRGGRLILPAAAAEYLPSLLALEKPQFFFDYEVLLASDFSELLALSKKVPDKRVAKISASFQEIRAKATPQTLGQYVANPFVRKRLVEIANEAPNHYSAKLLAILGAGNRPVFLPRNLLELEIRRALLSSNWIVTRKSSVFEESEIVRLGQSYESSRAGLELLARYVEKADRDLLDKAQELVAKIRTMERVVRKEVDYELIEAEYEIVVKAFLNLVPELAEPGAKTPPRSR